MPGHVEVAGTGSAGAVPDVVVVDARVSTEAADVAGAQAGCAEAVSAALEAAGLAGVATADLHTTGLALHPRHDRDGRAVIGYVATQSLRLSIRDPGSVGRVLTGLAGAAGDGLGVDAVRLDVADTAPLADLAREAAFADARARAEQYAVLAGRPLGPVLRVEEDARVVPPGPPARALVASADAGMPVAAGRVTVSASVRVRWGWGA
jgi:uncharacterized protein YggE